MGARISPERRARIAELRAEGRIWREIAAEVGMTPEGARRSFGRTYAATIGRPSKAVEPCQRPGGCEGRTHGGRKLCRVCDRVAKRRGFTTEQMPPKKRYKKGVDKREEGA